MYFNDKLNTLWGRGRNVELMVSFQTADKRKLILALDIKTLSLSYPERKPEERNVYFNDKLNTFWERGKKEGHVLFNDTLNTFLFTVIWRRTYGKGQFNLSV